MNAASRLSVLIALFVSISSLASAQTTWNELVDGGRDAGALPDSAHDLTGSNYSTFFGELSFSGDVDLYKIRIVSADSFAATTRRSPGSHPDTELWLFDANLLPVYYNDDEQSDASDHALLPRPNGTLGPTAPGTYYLAVTMYETIALDASGAELFENPRDFGPDWTRVNGPATSTPLASWRLLGNNGNPSGTYRVTLTGTGDEFINLSRANEQPEDFSVSAAYPNPLATSTTVNVMVDVPQHITARLYNLIGQDVGVVFSGQVAPGGARQIRVDASDLPAGSYFLRIQGDNFVVTRPLKVVR